MKTHTSRLASLGDLAELVRLRVLMQKEVHQTSDRDIDAAYLESVRQYFTRSLPIGSYVSAVAEAEGRLVAATGLIVFEKPPSLAGRNGRLGHVTNVYTEVEWRGRGIATELMELTVREARARQVDCLELGARKDALGVYERVGFKPTRWPQLEMRL